MHRSLHDIIDLLIRENLFFSILALGLVLLVLRLLFLVDGVFNVEIIVVLCLWVS
jgi:hypothetical protein